MSKIDYNTLPLKEITVIPVTDHERPTSPKSTLVSLIRSVAWEPSACARHLFVTSGNGYQWKDGDIVAIGNGEFVAYQPVNDMEAQLRTKGLERVAGRLALLREASEARNRFLRDLAETIADLMPLGTIWEPDVARLEGLAHISAIALEGLLQKLPDAISADWQSYIHRFVTHELSLLERNLNLPRALFMRGAAKARQVLHPGLADGIAFLLWVQSSVQLWSHEKAI